MIKDVVWLLVAFCIATRAASVVINEKAEVKTQDKLALNLYTYIDQQGIAALGNDSTVKSKTSKVNHMVRTIFANVGYNVISSSFAEPIDVFAQSTAERYLHEFNFLVSDHVKFRQQTLILFTGNRWPGVYAYAGAMCEKAGIAIIPLLNSTGLRSSRDVAYDVVRMIGVNIGLDNDLDDHCVCSGDLCIMESKRQADGVIRDWSTCSKHLMAKLRSKPPRACDPNAPPIPTVIQRGFQMPPLKVILIGAGMVLAFIICACCISAHTSRSQTPNDNVN